MKDFGLFHITRIMRRSKLDCLLVTLFLLCRCFGQSWSTVDVPEFQYPCYVDICTFPRQFCNSDKAERRCSPCSTSLCIDRRIPLACKYYCNTIQNHAGVNVGKEDGVPWQKHPLWFYCSIAGIAIIVLLMGIMFRRNITDCLRNLCPRNEKKSDQVSHETTPLKQDCGDGAESGVESMSSKDDVSQDPTGKTRRFPEVLQNINPTRGEIPTPTEMATNHSKAKDHSAGPQSSMNGSVKASSTDPSPQIVTSVSGAVTSFEGVSSETEDLTGDQSHDTQRNATTASGETSMATDLKHISGTPQETRGSNMVDTAIEMDSLQRDTGISSMTSTAER